MIEELQPVPIDEQILVLEKKLLTNLEPVLFRELISLRVKKYVEEGLSESEAKKKAYSEAEKEIKHDQELFGSSQLTHHLRWQFNGALLAMGYDKPDPLDKEVHGIKLATLDLETVKSLLLDSAEKYRDISEALNHLRSLYGDYSELTQMIILLKIKADHFSNK